MLNLETNKFYLFSKKGQNFCVGVCENQYYGKKPDFIVSNGEERVFSARNVVEIPLNWHGNQNLL